MHAYISIYAEMTEHKTPETTLTELECSLNL